MNIRSLIFGSTLGFALVLIPSSSTGCSAQTADAIVHDVTPLASCATNALADAFAAGVVDPLTIVTAFGSQCAGLTLQVLADVARDLLAAPSVNSSPDGGVGQGQYDARMVDALRRAHASAVLGALQAQGVVPNSK